MSPVRGNQDLQRAVLQKGHLWKTNQTFLSCKSTFRVFPNTANSPSLRLLSYHFAEPEPPAKGTWTIRREEKQPIQHKWCSRILNVALRGRTTEFEQEHESYNVLDIEVWSFWEHLKWTANTTGSHTGTCYHDGANSPSCIPFPNWRQNQITDCFWMTHIQAQLFATALIMFGHLLTVSARFVGIIG
jgi:hypothetical protein